MKPSEETIRNFYQHLGKLFYAMAMADKNLMSEEVDKLKEDVRKYWLDVDDVEDEFGTDAAYQIEIVFDWLAQEESEGTVFYGEFVDFYRAHPSVFTDAIKKLILITANDIAASFAGKNKSELILLAKLNLLFEGE